MKKRLNVILILILLVPAMASCAARTQDLSASDDLLREGKPIVSPTGLFTATQRELTDQAAASYRILISSTTDESTYLSAAAFRHRDSNFVLWSDEGIDVLWAYNGDTGVYIYVLEDGQWKEIPYAKNSDWAVPELLLQLRPGYF
ncbi:MAG: hypothetical protein FWE65_03300 [Eggerthellaceae bacterium]|nr:hypothetical protein [Eggerthellaceae bacterium]